MHLSKTRLDNLTATKRWEYLIKDCDPSRLARFWRFHCANPGIYEYIEQEAASRFAEGWKKASIWLILNIKRWSPGSTIDPSSSFKLSNDYFAFYSRLLISKNTAYVNWIIVKPLKGQEFDYSSDSFSGKNQ